MTARLATASAGTGKTHLVGKTIEGAASAGLAPARVLAVTFTNRAAAELLSRGREMLISAGRAEDAQALMLARVGTVHSVFGGIVAEAALAQGRSPATVVIPEAAQDRLFRIAADGAIGLHAARLNELAGRFGHGAPGDRRDWRKQLDVLVRVARENRLSPAALPASAAASWRTLSALLRPPVPNGAALDAALLASLRAAIAQARAITPLPDNGQKALARLVKAEAALSGDTRSWPEWAALSKLDSGAVLRSVCAPVIAAALEHDRHPAFHADLEAYVCTLFAAAADAMRDARTFRRQHGLMDFTDQEAEALDLLTRPGEAERVAGGVGLMLVDEFQDTSPLQLALFLRLLPHVPEVLCVGDPKQAIYGFRGSDPALVEAVRATFAAGPLLDGNRRSRPGIVAFCNALFGALLPRAGIPRAEIAVRATRADLSAQGPAVRLWRVHAGTHEAAARALAAQVARVLAAPADWPVEERGRPGEARPLRGGDVMVLVRANKRAEEVAAALCDAGLKVALARDGLLTRAEVALALAGLRVLADPRDTLAQAEVAHLLEGDAPSPAWLSAALADPASLRAHPAVAALEAARAQLPVLTPSEALDVAIEAVDLPGLLPRWGDAASRHAQLEALRNLARAYEEEGRGERRPCTPAGLAAWIQDLPRTEQPASPDPDAVQVMTAHRAKGLEAPMVVVLDDGEEKDARLFDTPAAMPREDAFDPTAPLEGRWVRFWPWPFGAQKADDKLRLSQAAAVSPAGLSAQETADLEAQRLLYVALTRARDHLVLAPRIKSTKGKGGAPKLEVKRGWVAGAAGEALTLPVAGGVVEAGGERFDVPHLDLAEEGLAAAPAPGWLPVLPAGPAPAFSPRRLRPSEAPETAARYEMRRLGLPMPPAGFTDPLRLGEALHGFLAADRPSAPRTWRLRLAERLRLAWNVAGVEAEALVEASDRLHGFLAAAHPGAPIRREWPVTVVRGGQVTQGTADMVVEAEEGLILIDHKSDWGGETSWEEAAREHAGQLAAYGAALTAATGRPVAGCFLHLPFSGVLLRLEALAADVEDETASTTLAR